MKPFKLDTNQYSGVITTIENLETIKKHFDNVDNDIYKTKMNRDSIFETPTFGYVYDGMPLSEWLREDRDWKVIDKFNITGRGPVLITDVEFDSKRNIFKENDEVDYESKKYIIVSVDAVLKSDKKGRMDYAALLVKEK